MLAAFLHLDNLAWLLVGKGKKGLQVVGFKNSSILKHDQSLYKYYDKNVHHIFDDSGTLSCCKTPYDVVHTPDTNCQNIPEEELFDFSEGEIDEIGFLLSSDDICNVNENESVQNVPDKLIDLADISAFFSEEKMSPLEKTVCGHYKDLLKTQRIDLSIL